MQALYVAVELEHRQELGVEQGRRLLVFVQALQEIREVEAETDAVEGCQELLVLFPGRLEFGQAGRRQAPGLQVRFQPEPAGSRPAGRRRGGEMGLGR